MIKRPLALFPPASIALAGMLLAALLWRQPPGEAPADRSLPELRAAAGNGSLQPAAVDRSPVDLVLAADGSWLVTANQTSDSLSLVSAASGEVWHEISCASHPVAVELVPGTDMLLASCRDSGQVMLLAVGDQRLQREAMIHTGSQPYGLAVTPDGKRAFVGLVATGEVAEIDLGRREVVRRIEVGPWPRYLTLSPDGARLAVGSSGASEIVVVDTGSGQRLYDEPLASGINLGHMQTGPDGKYAYFTWMVYRINPITKENIRRGWVLASRIGRVRLDGSAYREAISLDVPGKAVADPHGLVIGSDGKRLVASASGTHELLVYRLADLPFIGIGGPGDLIDRRLLADRDLFYRIELGGRPLGIALAADNRTVYVANYLRNSVQVVDIEKRAIIDEYELGSAPRQTLARRGEAIFYDGRRSLDQWYSCHTCHYNGGVNARPMDTLNDGTPLTRKTVLQLHNVSETKPWTWHGWQTSLPDAMQKSFTGTMQGEAISPEDTKAVLAFLDTLELPPNPFRNSDGSLTGAAERGREIFHGSKAGCANCHHGPHFTDGEIHDVGLGSDNDRYQGYNTPSLSGLYRKVRYLHDGRTKSLAALLTGPHAPAKVAGEADLNERELHDLVAYLKSL